MKKLFVFICIAAISTAAIAEPPRGVHHNDGHWVRHGSGWAWVVPALIGGVLTYEIIKTQEQRPVIIQEQPIVIQPQPVIVPRQTCTEWREYIGTDGKVYKERTCKLGD